MGGTNPAADGGNNPGNLDLGQLAVAADPNGDGPYAITEIDDMFKVAITGHNEAIHCAFPTSGPTAGPYPVVLVAHGFQLPPSQYYGYVRRLASFGYVALTVNFPASLLGVNNVENAHDLLGGIDWGKARAEVSNKADFSRIGATGHSLGGKVALLAATMDPHITASITLDPVDASVNCTPQNCPAVKTLVSALRIPTGFIGEITDAMSAGGMACAPAADNYTTYYANTQSPSIEVTAIGANHMSFLDDVSTCGLTCSFCNKATATNAEVNGMAKALVTAFYERYLRGDTRYDSYLTGATAQLRYVATGQAMIVSR